ncbi:MAG TPA: response regulator [Nitrososphaeraceae archaeon]|nr:response regulator [Nitrososphaeraceae archaeon]
MKKKKRILLVDDESDITTSLSMALVDYGYEVDSYNDPLAALSNFKPSYYDLVILDIKMPDMNGFELYRELEKIHSQIKVCFITAAGETYYEPLTEEAEEYCKIHKEMFLQKPFSNKEFIEEIKKRIDS